MEVVGENGRDEGMGSGNKRGESRKIEVEER